MNENRTDFLFKAASLLTRPVENKVYDILKSYYLMRCPEFLSKFELTSSLKKVRCSHCCLEWKRNTKCRIKRTKVNKKQKQKLKFCTDAEIKNHLLNCNQVEKICSFCGHVTSTPIPKINKILNYMPQQIKTDSKLPSNQKEKTIKKKATKKPLNVYSNTSDIFSLRNENNKLKPSVETVKIKNNKKKKDKYAGLCQQAVLASAKMKQDELKKNKLDLFLKPSV